MTAAPTPVSCTRKDTFTILLAPSVTNDTFKQTANLVPSSPTFL